MTFAAVIRRRKPSADFRRELYRRNPHCHWCGDLTVLPEDCLVPGDALMATLDHVKSRLEAGTAAEYHAPENQVLSCFLCNVQRDAELHGAFERGEKRPIRYRVIKDSVKPLPKPSTPSDDPFYTPVPASFKWNPLLPPPPIKITKWPEGI